MAWMRIQGLRIAAPIGVYVWEQQLMRTLEVDLHWQIASEKIAEKDTIDATMDYDVLAKSIDDFFKANPCQLLETAAEQLKNYLIQTYQLTQLRLWLRKPYALPNAQTVEVFIDSVE